MNGDYGFGHFGGGPIGILFWILIIVVIVVAARWLTTGRQDTNNSNNKALDILNQRYARGEIEREEYEQKRREITGQDN